ncbi:MAG TPA: hypothetical protein VLG74_05580 [Blastocatellia bacterium]|nr:hypothetical protein [Blastocatellia bacterium]
MSVFEAIASLNLTCIRETGEQLEVLVQIGRPCQSETGEWACELSLGRLYPNLAHIVGEDSLQALCLALSLARQLLTDFIETGGRILIAGTDSELPIDAYFPGVRPASTGS